MTASRAGLENKVGLALNEIGEIVGNEKGDMKGKVAVVSLLSNRIYDTSSRAMPKTIGATSILPKTRWKGYRQ